MTAQVMLSCNDENPDVCRARMWFQDAGVDNVSHVNLVRLELIIDYNDNGGAVVLRGSNEDSSNKFPWYWFAYSFTAPCLHPGDSQPGIERGDRAWAQAIYRIYYNNGTSSDLRNDDSPHILFNFVEQCT